MRRRTFLKCLGVGALAMHGHARAADAPAQERPNILWLSAEDIEPRLGCYGDAYASTPNLDRLAAEGIRYENAYAHAPVCSPARSGIITGMYPCTIGSLHHRSSIDLPEHIRCFPAYLRDAGYYCTNHTKKDYNFKEAPDTWDASNKKAHWRNRKPGQPFFSVFNHTVCHESAMHRTDESMAELCEEHGVTPHAPAKAPIPPYHPDLPEMRTDWAHYYDAISVMDAQVGAILRQLEEDGLADSTIVMFWGDHGTGIARGKRWLYETGTRVPLIARFPERFKHLAPKPAGSVEAGMVNFIDFAPTVLALAGVEVPGHMQGRPFAGPNPAKPHDSLYFFRSRCDYVYDTVRAVRDGRYRYIRNYEAHLPYYYRDIYLFKARSARAWEKAAPSLTGAPALFMQKRKPLEELYDLEADPDNVHNLAQEPAHREDLLRMRRILREAILDKRDLGLLDEGEMHRRLNGRPPHALAMDEKAFDLPTILEAADLPLEGTDAVPALMERLTHVDSGVRYWAVVGFAALEVCSAPEVKEALALRLEDDAPSVRVAAADLLSRLNGNAKAMDALMKELEHPLPFIRMRVLDSLGMHGAAAASKVEVIKLYLEDDYVDVQRAATAALEVISEALAEQGG